MPTKNPGYHQGFMSPEVNSSLTRALAQFFGVAIMWASRARPNYAIKVTSVETLNSSESSSGASVPSLGCQAASCHH